MRNIKKALINLLSISVVTIAMENPHMIEVWTLEQAQLIADRFVVYQPRKTLGERVAMPKELNELNYGYIDPRVEYYPDEKTGFAYLKLFALGHIYACAVTRVISDKTLAEEALLVRTANLSECKRIEEILKSPDHYFQYEASHDVYESYCRFSRADLKTMTTMHRIFADVLKDQIELLQEDKK